MTDIIYIEIAVITLIALGIISYSLSWYFRVTRPPKPYPGTEEAPKVQVFNWDTDEWEDDKEYHI